MGKLNQLLGIANNLAASFVSVTNIHFLGYIELLPAEKTKLFKIDLLKETIAPEELNSEEVAKVIKNYKKWFLSEIKRSGILLDDIENVLISTAYKPGKSFARYYTCTVTIKAKGKEFTKKVISSYM
jgi:hypothetical protein